MLTREELGSYGNEFEVTKAAQSGDQKAWMILWKHYKKLILSKTRHVKGFSNEELESEAIVLFTDKLRLFNPDKVKKPEGYSMYSWLYLGAINLTNKLIRQRKREVHLYNEQISAIISYPAGGGGGGSHLPLTCLQSLWKAKPRTS